MELVISELNDIIQFMEQLSYSNSYTLFSNNEEVEHKEYEKLNGEHLFSVAFFLGNFAMKNKSIVLTFD